MMARVEALLVRVKEKSQVDEVLIRWGASDEQSIEKNSGRGWLRSSRRNEPYHGALVRGGLGQIRL